MESLKECLNLFLDGFGHFSITQHLDILHLILICDRDVSAVRFQVDHLDFAKVIERVGKCQIEDISHVILGNPHHVLIELVVLLLHVEICDG